ncbi:MAG TPA: cell filamentation protein Fic, partial [Rikenellaceae bacterium]|nr:cell filamentation protein Fic [Rikenellaceae bacterium]
NKMHFSAHGHTAAELIYARADADKDFMGLTSWIGAMPKRHDAEVAKNYLTMEELDTLNRIVSLYLDFAEYDKFHTRIQQQLSPVELHFLDSLEAEQKQLQQHRQYKKPTE